MKVLLLLVGLTFYSTYALVCIENIALNESYPEYIDSFNSSSYCGSIIEYPISDTTASEAETRHARMPLFLQNKLSLLVAQANYFSLATKWRVRASSSDNPTNDCLGVARTFFCTQAFPRCSDDAGDVRLRVINYVNNYRRDCQFVISCVLCFQEGALM